MCMVKNEINFRDIARILVVMSLVMNVEIFLDYWYDADKNRVL